MATQKKDLLLIFSRNPVLGKVKKRLAAKVGEKTALEIYKFLLLHTCKITQNLQVDKRIFYSERIEENDIWNASVFQKNLQSGADLGERMSNAFQQGFNDGYKRIIIIGSDLFDLDQEDLEKAFSALEEADYVIGPAIDGGYYLLGMKSVNTTIFEQKIWGTPTVLEKTLNDIKNERITLLEERNDIDIYEDLEDHSVLRHLINTINDKNYTGDHRIFTEKRF